MSECKNTSLHVKVHLHNYKVLFLLIYKLNVKLLFGGNNQKPKMLTTTVSLGAMRFISIFVFVQKLI